VFPRLGHLRQRAAAVVVRERHECRQIGNRWVRSTGCRRFGLHMPLCGAQRQPVVNRAAADAKRLMRYHLTHPAIDSSKHPQPQVLTVCFTHTIKCSLFSMKRYIYPKDYLYKQNIHKPVFLLVDVAQLYEWKNGNRLSQKKQAAFDTKIGARLQRINQLKQELHIDHFREEFADISAIWKIFLLHIIAPDIYPIFDQHVFRSYSYLTI
jgi:hypothetical protein